MDKDLWTRTVSIQKKPFSFHRIWYGFKSLCHNIPVTTGSDFKDYDYPSFSGIFLFWEKAKEEFVSENPTDKKQACEKAYRASTEAIDLLLAKFSRYIPVGHPEAHALRSNYIVELYDVIPEMKLIDHYYSTFKDKLHGLGYYSGFDATRYKKIFNQVEEFIKLVQKILEVEN